MGEKIRDIKEIKIGKSKLMVELNEGYSASQGLLIHIQNKKFRYLLTEEDFFHLSTMVMRAWSEFDFLKRKKPDFKQMLDFQQEPEQQDCPCDLLYRIDTLFKHQNIEYRVLDNHNGKVSLLIKFDCLKNAEESLSKIGAKKTKHPMGLENGYKFLYQMNPFSMYVLNDNTIEIFCQLPCRSITKKTWIPLDRMIQKHLWSSQEDINGIPWCDKISQYLYFLCFAVFVDKGFSAHTRQILSENSEILSIEGIEEYFSVIFFNFSHSIINLLLKEDYDRIIPEYHSFIDY